MIVKCTVEQDAVYGRPIVARYDATPESYSTLVCTYLLAVGSAFCSAGHLLLQYSASLS